MKRTLFLATAVLAAAAALNAAPPDAAAAFDRLKSLAGEWEADSSMGKVHVRYELIASGSAVVERIDMDKMPAMSMITVYHLDGTRLMLTHYCMEGNQPRMQAQTFRPDAGELEFQFLDATNLKSPKAGHMHNAKFKFVDANHFAADWSFFENGASKNTESFKYTRVR